MCILLSCVAFCYFYFILFIFLSLFFSITLFIWLFLQHVLKLFSPLYSNLIQDSGWCIQILQTAYIVHTTESWWYRLSILTLLSSARHYSVLFTTRHYRPIHLLFYGWSYLQPYQSKPGWLLCSTAITHLFFPLNSNELYRRHFCDLHGWKMKRVTNFFAQFK